MKIRLLYLLSFICITSCASNTVITKQTPIPTDKISASPSPQQSSIVSEQVSPLPQPTAMTTVGPNTSVDQNIEITPSTMYLRNSPQKVCYQNEITITGKFDSKQLDSNKATVDIYIEDKTDNKIQGKIPLLYYKHILLNKFEIESEKEFQYTFKVDKTLKSFDGKNTLEMNYGRYSIYLDINESAFYGADGFEISECQ